jgi:alpha-mannosidase
VEFEDRFRINQKAETFHLPLLPVPRKNTGDLAADKSYLELAPAGLTISAVKESEDGGQLVVRVYNTMKETVDGVLRCAVPVERAWEARLDEQPVAETAVQSGHTVPICIQPQGVKTIRLQTGEGS